MFELPSKDGNITPEKVRKSRQMQFRDKTAYVWGLCYRWDPTLSMNPVRRFAHFMPPWIVTIHCREEGCIGKHIILAWIIVQDKTIILGLLIVLHPIYTPDDWVVLTVLNSLHSRSGKKNGNFTPIGCVLLLFLEILPSTEISYHADL